MSLPYEKQLAEIEDHCRLAGYEISLAQILGWFIDNDKIIYEQLMSAPGGRQDIPDGFRDIIQRLTDELDESFPPEHNFG